jgi:hypothetical protein
MKEVWATYSVKDHTAPKAFVADVMMYDRLVIPVPAKGDEAHWEEWDVSRQERLLKILGERAVCVVWDAQWQAKWQSQWDAAKAVGDATSPDAFRMTPSVLLESVPKTVTGVAAVATFSSADEMRAALKMREAVPPSNPGGPYASGPLAAVIGREFLVPDDPAWNDEDLLRAAVDIAGDVGFRRKRAAYWRWQREFLADWTLLDQEALNQAVEEMGELINEEKAEARKSTFRLGVSFAFAAGAAAVGMFTPPLAPLALAGGFLSIGGWAIDHVPEVLDQQGKRPDPSAMCVSAQREFGWAPSH